MRLGGPDGHKADNRMITRTCLRYMIAVVVVMATAAISLSGKTILGDAQFSRYVPCLEGKRVAIFSNQSGVVGDKVLKGKNFDLSGQKTFGPHLADVMLKKKVNVTVIFSPEHGFRGNADAGAKVGNSIDAKTGVPIVSLYGAKNQPSEEDMSLFDVLLVDIQDVGLRYYTYYITMYRLMDVCARNNKKVIVLDRPNPNGFYVDGPVLDMNYKSGVGYLPIPVVHGMTLGELALMINGEKWLPDGGRCNLEVIPCRGYTHRDKYSLIMPPSPNLKTMRSVYLYSSLCFFEGTVISLGRGTDHPFEMYGSPDMGIYSYRFRPESMPGAVKPDYMGEWCYGIDLTHKSLDDIWREGVNLEYVVNAYRVVMAQPGSDAAAGTLADGRSFFGKKPFFDKLMGNSWVREMIMKGASAAEIKSMWKDDVEKFKARRKPYLLYAE